MCHRCGLGNGNERNSRTTKSLLRSAKIYAYLKRGQEFGILPGQDFQFDQFQKATKQVVSLADASVRAAADNASKAASPKGRKAA